MIQQYSLNVQAELHKGWLLEIGYVGTRGTHLVRQRSLNQALRASTNDPIRGVTTNTFANIPLRVPILGVPPDSLVEMESEGSSWYNGLDPLRSTVGRDWYRRPLGCTPGWAEEKPPRPQAALLDS